MTPAQLAQMLSWPHPSEQGTMYTTTLHDGVEFPLILANPYAAQSPIDIRRWGSFQNAGAVMDIHHYTRGVLTIKCDSLAPALDSNGNAVISFAADIRVIENFGGIPTIIAAGIVNSNTPPMIVPLSETMPGRSIAVEARQLVNGAPDGDTVSQQLQLTIVGRVYR